MNAPAAAQNGPARVPPRKPGESCLTTPRSQPVHPLHVAGTHLWTEVGLVPTSEQNPFSPLAADAGDGVSRHGESSASIKKRPDKSRHAIPQTRMLDELACMPNMFPELMSPRARLCTWVVNSRAWGPTASHPFRASNGPLGAPELKTRAPKPWKSHVHFRKASGHYHSQSATGAGCSHTKFRRRNNRLLLPRNELEG